MSKPSGGAFAVKNWLDEDGDVASQEQAAARPAWQGDRRDRQADLPNGWKVAHFTGKGSAQRALPACQPGRIVIVSERVDLRKPPCLLFDESRLRRSGAVAIDFAEGRPIVTTTAEKRPPPGVKTTVKP